MSSTTRGSGSNGVVGSVNVPFDSLYSDSTLNAMRAQTVCGCLLIIAAFIASVMVWRRSWLESDGTRDKRRRSTFLLCLISILVGRAIYVANTVLTLQGPNTWSGSKYYNTIGFRVRYKLFPLFEWVSTILFLSLVLVEVRTHNKRANHKRTMFDKIGSLTILVILAITLTNWVITVYAEVVLVNGYGRRFASLFFTVLGLSLTYAILAFIFATAMLVTVGIRFHASAESIPKSRSRIFYPLLVTGALWLSQVFLLVRTCLTYFGVQLTALFGIYATYDLVWILNIGAMTLLAQESYKSSQAEQTDDSDAALAQSDYDAI